MLDNLLYITGILMKVLDIVTICFSPLRKNKFVSNLRYILLFMKNLTHLWRRWLITE